MECFFDMFSVATVSGSDAEVVCCGESRGGHMKGGGLSVRPDARAFAAVDVLDHFVLDIAEDVVAESVFCFADICSNFDEEGVFLKV